MATETIIPTQYNAGNAIAQQPFDGLTRPVPDISAKDEIAALAREHGVTYQKTALDDLGNAITRLAGDEVPLDETVTLLIALQRAGVVSDSEADRLHISYMRQRRS